VFYTIRSMRRPAHLCLHWIGRSGHSWQHGSMEQCESHCLIRAWKNGGTQLQGVHKKRSREIALVLICTSWNIWIEQNPRIF
jgi:hypothetical protein